MPHKCKQPQQQHSRKPSRAVEDDNFHAKKHHRRKHHLLDDGDGKSVYMVDPPPSLAVNIPSERSIRPALLSCVAGQRGGANTPVPGWKYSNYPFQTPGVASNRPERVLVSARKLAAILWELYGTPVYQVCLHGNLNEESHSAYFKNRNELSMAPFLTTQQYRGMHKKLSYYSRKSNTSGNQGSSAYSQVSGQLETLRESTSMQSYAHDADEVVKSEVQATNVSRSDVKSKTTDCSLISNDLVKLLNQIWALEEQYNSNVRLVAKLQADLKKAKTREEELNMVQKSSAADIEKLTKMLVDESAKLCEREQQNVKEAIMLLKEQLEEEKQAKQKLQLHYVNLTWELNEVKKAMAKALDDLERERKAKELIEDVCDQLAKECQEDKVELEELTGNSPNGREKGGREQKMLQLARVWQEERAKMKLAKLQSETGTMKFNLDKLKALLRVKQSFENGIQKKGTMASANVHVHHDPNLSQVEKNEFVGNFAANDEAGCCSQAHNWVVDGGAELNSYQLNKEPNARKEGDRQGSRIIIQLKMPTKESNAGKEGDKQGGQASNDSSGKLEQKFNRPDEGTVSSCSPSDKKAVADSPWIERILRKSELRDWKGERGSSLEPEESAHSPWQAENTRSQDFLFPGTKRKLGRSELRGHSSSFPKGRPSNTNVVPSHVFGDCMAPTSEHSAHSRLSVSHEQSFTNATSPTYQWGPGLLPAGPSIQDRSIENSLKEMPWIARASSLKAKLEAQQNQ